MKLFYNPASPYVRKVLVVAIESDLESDIEKHALGLSPVSPSEDLNSHNPIGKIPALVLDDGSTLFDSRVICEYLDTLGNASLFPANGVARWKALQRQAAADGLCDAAILGRYERFIRPENLQWDDWYEGQLAKCLRTLDAFESEADTLVDTVDIGTLSMAISLSYLDFRYPQIEWASRCPGLAGWFTPFYQRASLQNTLPAELSA